MLSLSNYEKEFYHNEGEKKEERKSNVNCFRRFEANKISYLQCRVLDIIRSDAQKDPAIYPEALRARLLVNQVLIPFPHVSKPQMTY